MSVGTEDWKTEREDRLVSAIVDEIARFGQWYGHPSPEETAWSQQLAEWTRAWCDYMRGEPNARPPSRPSVAGVSTPTDEVRPRRVAVETTKIDLSAEELEEKRWRWRRMWARIHAFIAVFRSEQRDAVGDDGAWAARIARDMDILVARQHRELEIEHPGMPPINDIDAEEILHALLFDEDEDPDDEHLLS